MNTTMLNERLDAMSADIARLDALVVEMERDALSLVGDEATWIATLARVADTKAALVRALREHFILTEFIRKGARRAA